ncbi:hypothetical protein HYFRA_00000299 [Hymenoscyphus fraxineus]|uniref:Transcription factor hoxa13 n=1 Tax=Hymenoscyphus fraxineus TaxID=746836 RepID=A0A9N9L1A3_9HELO|nr:hypothetical protein HYFRA_00000299 [Hymenoscyphus fraxineus]
MGSAKPIESGKKSQSSMNNGKAINGQPKSPPTKSKSKTKTPKKTGSRLLLTWYSIITIYFRCPSTPDLLTDTSPRICKPYFQLESAVSPYLSPYYDVYAAPYVDKVKPYYETANQKVIIPVIVLGKKYGAPRVAQAQSYGQAQWEKNVQPLVQKYQDVAKTKYDETLGPHIMQAVDVTSPYYAILKTNALQTYYGHILPTYNMVKPHVIDGYLITSDFALNTAFPYTQWAWTTSAVFVERTIWPQVRILYGENVEPQLVRIGQRLGRYRDGKKLKTVVDEVDSSSSAPSTSSDFSASEFYSSTTEDTETIEVTEPPSSEPTIEQSTEETTESEEEIEAKKKAIREKAQEIVTNDLRVWQEKFAKAADEGSDEMEERITEISETMVKQAKGVGNALIVQLEETVKSGFKSLKRDIISIVESKKDSEECEKDLSQAVRKTGLAIKEKGQAVRNWKLNFDQEMNSLLEQTASDTFDVLDTIRDMGLQEIGMRWAWTDGITHKHWTKYHKLKGKFEEWRLDVEKVIIEHPGLDRVRAAAEDNENRAMAIAEEAAKELARLKETGRWKISMEDSSDDFSTKHMPAAAASLGKNIKEKVVEGGENAQDVIQDALSKAQGTVSSVSEAIVGGQQGGVESIASVATENAKSAGSEVSSVVSNASSSLSSATSSIASSLSTSLDAASISVESAEASASSTAPKKVWGGAMAQKVEARQIIFDDFIDDSDDDTFSERLQSMASEAGDKYADITKAVSEALLKPTSTPGHQVTKLAAQKYSSALAAASSVLYGTEKGAGESVASIASSRYSDAVSAASVALYGSPAPVTASIVSQASGAYSNAQAALESAKSLAQSRLSEGLDLAASRFSDAKNYVAAINTGTTQKQKLSVQMQEQYYAGIGLAHARYSEYMAAVSAAIMPKPTPFHESVYSKASVGIVGTEPHGYEKALSTADSYYSIAVSKASAQLKNFLSSISSAGAKGKDVVPTSSLAAQASSQYSASVAEASSSYSSISSVIANKIQAQASQASGAVYGSETPLTEKIASKASENWEALINKASEQIYGAPTPYFVTRQLLSEAKEYGAVATGAATSQYFVVQSIISELIIGKDATFTESVYNKLSSAYYTNADDVVSSASSFANEAYSSVFSAVSVMFTPPATIEIILDSASSRVNDVVQAASIQIYGTKKGSYEQASSAAASAYSSIQSAASAKIYGTSTGYAEAASSSISVAALSAQRAISEAIYGTPTGKVEAATNVAEKYASATAAAAQAYASAQAKISKAIYGEEQGAIESAQSRLSAAVESARARLAEFAANAGEGASEFVKQASEGVEEFASSVSSAVAAGKTNVKDEL